VELRRQTRPSGTGSYIYAPEAYLLHFTYRY
jgi:hypothetical protein